MATCQALTPFFSLCSAPPTPPSLLGAGVAAVFISLPFRDGALNFNDPESGPARSKIQSKGQPAASFKTVYLQLSGDKYRCAIRSTATWDQLKQAVEARLGLPPAVARLSSLRGVRDGALIRTGHDVEHGEFLNVTLDMRPKRSGVQPPPGKVRSVERAHSARVGTMPVPGPGRDTMRATSGPGPAAEGGPHGRDLSKGALNAMWAGNATAPGPSGALPPSPGSARGQRGPDGRLNGQSLGPGWVGSTNPRTMAASSKGIFGPDPKRLTKETPSPWIQAATGDSHLAPILTNVVSNPHAAGQLAGAGGRQARVRTRPQSAPASRKKKEEAKEEAAAGDLTAKHVARAKLTEEDHRAHNGDWAKLGVNDNHFGLISGDGHRVRPRSAPAARTQAAAPKSAPRRQIGTVRSRPAGISLVPPMAAGDPTAALGAQLGNPMDSRQRQQHRQMNTFEGQVKVSPQACEQWCLSVFSRRPSPHRWFNSSGARDNGRPAERQRGGRSDGQKQHKGRRRAAQEAHVPGSDAQSFASGDTPRVDAHTQLRP